MKERKKCLLLLFLGSILLLGGCGDKNEKVKLGMESIESMDYQGALTQFEEAKTLEENSKLIARGQGLAYLGLGDYDNAVASFLEALSYSDGYLEKVDYDINLYLATAYCKQNKYTEASEIYDAILDLQPNNKEALYQRGTIRLMTGQLTDAQADFEQLMNQNPTDFDLIIQIYECLNQYGYKDLGRTYLSNAKENYLNKMSEYDKGRIYYYLEDYQQAYLAFESAKDKGGAKASLYLGKSYEATGDYDYAVRVYQGFLEKEGDDAGIYNQLGLCYMEKGEYQQALSAFEKGLAMEDKDYTDSIKYNEAVCYEYLRQFDKAKELFAAYLKNNPGDQKAKREYDFLSTR